MDDIQKRLRTKVGVIVARGQAYGDREHDVNLMREAANTLDEMQAKVDAMTVRYCPEEVTDAMADRISTALLRMITNLHA